MKKTTTIFILAVCIALTFIIPIIQLSIGFNFIVDNGDDPDVECRAAPDLPVILAIGGVFALFFLGSAYSLLKIIASNGKADSDMSGRGPKILLGEFVCLFAHSIE